jgi:hypothetical protein
MIREILSSPFSVFSVPGVVAFGKPLRVYVIIQNSNKLVQHGGNNYPVEKA